MDIVFLSREECPSYREDIASLIENELASKCKVVFFARRDTGKLNNYKKVDYRLTLCLSKKGKFNFLNRLIQFGVILRCLFHVYKEKPDFLIVRDDPLALFLSLWLSKITSTKICYWMSFLNGDMQISHARKYGGFFRTLLAKMTMMLEDYGLSNTSKLIVQSEAMADYIRDKYGNNSQILSMPMGVNFDKVNRFFIDNPNLKVKSKTICYLGSLDLSRDIYFLLDVLQQVRSQVDGVTLVLAGGSFAKGTENKLKQEILSRGLEDYVKVTGHLSRELAWKNVCESEVCLSYIPRNKYYDVSSPTKFIEYLALNKKIVASDIPDQMYLAKLLQIDCIVENNVASYTDKIIKLLQEREHLIDMSVLERERAYHSLGKSLFNWLIRNN